MHLLSPVNQYEQHAAARLLEFFRPETHWNRGLWSTSFGLSLREVIEASEANRSGILGPNSVQTATESVLRQIGVDPGIGGESERHLLQQALNGANGKKSLRTDGLDYLVLRQMSESIERDYLLRWSHAVADESNRPQPERLARAVASHLLDRGFSPGYLHRWWSYRFLHESPVRPLSEMIKEAAEKLANHQEHEFEVIVPFASPLRPSTKSGFQLPPNWLDSVELSKWLTDHRFETTGIRQQGGLRMLLRARDAEAAAHMASEQIDTFSARVLVSLRKEVRPQGHVWVAGTASPFPIQRPNRGVHVGAIHREDRIWLDGRPHDLVDRALELLAPLQSSSPSAAVAGGWAAVEALLSEPDDRAMAADRLAMIVACSFPRAELTMLSYGIEGTNSRLSSKLAGNTNNLSRCLLVAEAINQGEQLSLTRPADLASWARMKSILHSPRVKLNDIQAHVADTVRRLYRQRNLVLHGGATNAVALRVCLRTSAPLVGAGIDRVVHAWYVEGISPLELSARSRIALGTLKPGDVSVIVNLLGTGTA